MFRRVSSGMLPRAAAAATTTTSGNSANAAVAVARRHLEPMSVWYLSSWSLAWYYSFFFWFPVLWADVISPTMANNKLPMLHLFQEKRAEAKLRRVLDETYTQWDNDLNASHITEAITRTF